MGTAEIDFFQDHLSLGKLSKDHGYSYEWVNGQKPRLTKDGMSIICKTDKFVPLVVLVLATNFGSVSSSTLPPQDSSRREVETVSGNRAASRSLPASVSERSDELATRRLVQESLKDDKKDADDPFADLPFWLAKMI